jgi:hypothetical protein
MRLAFALAALVVAAEPACADMSFVGVGQRGVFNTTYVGCQDQGDEDRFKSLVRDGDKEAAVKFSDRKGDACTRMSPGMIGTVEDLSVFHGTSCLRLRGEPQCVWVPTEFVDKSK